MALTTTTLAAAVALNDKSVLLTSVTGLAPGMQIKVGVEKMEVTKDWVPGTAATVPVNVLRGRGGSTQYAHVITENATFGLPSDFSDPAPGAFATEFSAIRPTVFTSITATTSTLTLPPPGCDMRVILNGTSAITLTIPVPTQDLDGCLLYLLSNGVAQHVYTFTGGLGGVGTGYTTVTPASGARGSIVVCAVNGAWNALSGPGWSGTVTKVTCAQA